MTRLRSFAIAFAVTFAVLMATAVWTADAAAPPLHTHRFPATTAGEWSTSGARSDRPFTFSIYADGREVDQLGEVRSACRYFLDIPGLSLKLTRCHLGVTSAVPLIVHWQGSAFTLRWHS